MDTMPTNKIETGIPVSARNILQCSISLHMYTRLYNFERPQMGFFFAANASNPIFVFSELISFSIHLSAVICVARSTLAVSHASLKPCRVTKMASGEIPVICFANSNASSIRDSGVFAILFIRWKLLASSAESLRPVRAISDAI